MLLKGIYVLSLQFSCSVEITKKTNVQIINNKEAPWITLSKQHLAHDSQLEQQLSLGSLLLRDAHCGNNQFLAINWIWMKFAKMLFFLQDWILNFMRENSNYWFGWFSKVSNNAWLFHKNWFPWKAKVCGNWRPRNLEFFGLEDGDTQTTTFFS